MAVSGEAPVEKPGVCHTADLICHHQRTRFRHWPIIDNEGTFLVRESLVCVAGSVAIAAHTSEFPSADRTWCEVRRFRGG